MMQSNQPDKIIIPFPLKIESKRKSNKTKYHPNFIIYTAFLRYLSRKKKKGFKEILSKLEGTTNKYCYNTMLKNFNIEKLRKEPLIWEDIWVYNHCIYDVKTRLLYTGLIKKYEDEAFILKDADFWREVKRRKQSNDRDDT